MPNRRTIVNKETENKIIDLYSTGKSINYIRNNIMLSPKVITRVITSNGLAVRNKRTLPHNEVLEKYKNGVDRKEIAREYGVTDEAIYYVFVKYGIMKKGKKRKVMTPEQEKDFLNRFLNNNEPCNKICNEYDVSPSNGYRILRKNNVSPQKNRSYRKYTLNEHYFDTIDSEDKAYFLGLLYADGFNGEDSGEIEIGLKDRDIDILNKLNESIGSNKPIRFRRIMAESGYIGRYARLWIHSRIMSKRLAELGCVQRKSLILEFPKEEAIPKHLLRHFIRGFYDGNGYISQVSKIYGTELVSTIMFIERLQDILIRELGIQGCIVNHISGKTIRIFKIGGTVQPLKFLDWLYKDATIYLDRKHKRYQALKKDREMHVTSSANPEKRK